MSAVVLPFLRPDRELSLVRLVFGEIPANVETCEDDLSLQDRIALVRDTAEENV